MTQLPAAIITALSLILCLNVWAIALRPWLQYRQITRFERWLQHQRAQWQDAARAMDWDTLVLVAVMVAGVAFVFVSAVVDRMR